VVVANSRAAHQAMRPIEGITLVRGSNTDHEFSAYDEGLQVARTLRPALQVAVLANDRMQSYPDRAARLLSPDLLAACRDENLATGRLQAPRGSFNTGFGPLGAYIRSNFLTTQAGLPA
jgi:hypothetical protein